jgi:diguanylate cyclase (GGDEF)-like protein
MSLSSGASAAAELWQSLILLDVDHFKAINDRLGHQEGDRVLAQIARLLRAELAGAGHLYRYGGEEFAVMLPAFDESAAMALAERLRQAVAAAGLLEPAVTLSAGVASWDPRKLPIGRAVDAADRALYEAKRQGRDRVVHSSALG